MSSPPPAGAAGGPGASAGSSSAGDQPQQPEQQGQQQGAGAAGEDSQQQKRQRTDSSAGGSNSGAAAAPAASASSSAAGAASALPAALREQMLLAMRRFVTQVTTGCQRAGGCNNPDCVTGGMAPLQGNQALAFAQQLFKARKESCVPAPAGTAAPAVAASSASVASAAPPATPAPASASARSTSASASAAAASPNTPVPSTPAPTAASVLATPQAPQRPTGAPAASPLSPAPFASLAALSSVPRPRAPSSSRAAADASPASAASSSAAAAASALASAGLAARSAPSPPPSPRASPSLAQMLSETSSAPLKSTEAPIESASAWVAQVDAARAAWEAAGSPANDMSFFRPLTTRIYKVFNELNCLALSFRVPKDKEEEAASAAAAAGQDGDVQMKSGDSEKKPSDAMEDDATSAALASDSSSSAAAAAAAATAAAPSDASAPWLSADEFSPALDYTEIDAFYASIMSVCVTDSKGEESFPLLTSLLNGLRALLNELILRPLGAKQVSPMLLRAVLIMLENADLWSDPSHYEELARLLRFVASLPRVAKKLLVSWFEDVEKWQPGEPAPVSAARKRRMFSLERLERLLGVLQQFISVRIYDKRDLRDVVPAVVVVSLLHEANEHFARLYRSIPLNVPRSAKAPVPLAYQLFNNDAVNELADLKQDFRRWMMQQQGHTLGSEDFSFSKFNFILDAGSKATLLKYDAAVQQQAVYRDSLLANGMNERAGYLVLEVARHNLIADTMRQLANKQPTDLKKPLKIHFKGEKGIDAGGLRKEFFQLIIGELFDARYGMFLVNEETRTLAFNPDSMESTFEFELLGVLLGIAIYNSTILELHFPPVIYKKLLGIKPTLDDLLEAQPTLARGLLQLLEFDGDVEAVFARDFTVSRESYGEQIVVPLKPDGDKTPVTNANRAEFVQLYVEYVLEKSVAKQFGAFSRGFHRVCGGPALQLFRSEELELLICGAQEFDWAALEASTHYEDGYTRESPVCRQFWEIVHEELSLDEKKKLLEFCTGSDRVPIRGLAAMRLTISKQGPDSPQLPTSHTCFNHLLLPQYESKDKLRKMLKLALQNSKGFGLI